MSINPTLPEKSIVPDVADALAILENTDYNEALVRVLARGKDLLSVYTRGPLPDMERRRSEHAALYAEEHVDYYKLSHKDQVSVDRDIAFELEEETRATELLSLIVSFERGTVSEPVIEALSQVVTRTANAHRLKLRDLVDAVEDLPSGSTVLTEVIDTARHLQDCEKAKELVKAFGTKLSTQKKA